MEEVQQTAQTEQAAQTAQPAPEPKNTEEMISKKQFDEKVSEMNKTIKQLKAERDAKLSEEEKIAEKQNEMQQALKAARDEVAQLRTESTLAAAGISPECSHKLSKAIVAADTESIVAAVKDAATEIIRETEARVKRELLEQGAPKIGFDSGNAEKPDKFMNIVKNIASGNAEKPDSKWLK